MSDKGCDVQKNNWVGEKRERYSRSFRCLGIYEAEPDTEHKGKRYFYMLNGVDKSGNENTIKVGLSGKDEYQDCYLKVHVKGKYVYGFEEVQEKEVPEKTKEILKK
ncbi:YxeA family protein [Brevibacillus laterosporus]|nr:YxeA family protein [Brevibacillus laterosporus]TPG86945.1 YxeA family protein [Brevibacillus laterosporus]